MATALIHIDGGKAFVSLYGDGGKLIKEYVVSGGFEEIPCEGNARVSPYGFGGGALIVVEGCSDGY